MNGPLTLEIFRRCCDSDPICRWTQYPSPLNVSTCVCKCVCFTSVDGNWGSWQPWGECSASCGGGERTRVRLCNNPSPNSGGRACPGDASQLSRCNAQACPGWTLVPCQVQFSVPLAGFPNGLSLFHQEGRSRPEEASSGTSTTLSLASQSSTPVLQTAKLVAK